MKQIKNKSIINHLAGFTLIEVVVVIGITALLVSAAIVIFFQVIQTSNRAQTVNEVRQSGNQITETMVREIRKAKSIQVCPGDVFNCFTTYYDVNCGKPAAKFYVYGNEDASVAVSDRYQMLEQLYDQETDAPLPLANLTSNKVAVVDCPTIGSTCPYSMENPSCLNGFKVIATDRITEQESTLCLTEAKVTLKLTIQQNNPQIRSEFCGKVVLNQSVSTRNY